MTKVDISGAWLEDGDALKGPSKHNEEKFPWQTAIWQEDGPNEGVRLQPKQWLGLDTFEPKKKNAAFKKWRKVLRNGMCHCLSGSPPTLIYMDKISKHVPFGNDKATSRRPPLHLRP